MSDPRRIGARYELLERLDGGADGSVWRGRDLRTGSRCVVRVLRLDLPVPTGLTAAARRWQLVRTAETVARLAHPGLVPVDDIVAGDGQWALISRLVPGESLADRLARTGPVPAAEAARIVAQLCDALAAAHAAGLAHGRVKPSNLLLEPGGGAAVTVRLTDFGLAALESWAAHQVAPDPATAAARARYRPPEWIPGMPATPAGDVYAAGLVLYEALAGWPPFDGGDAEQTARLHVETPLPRVPDVSDELWALLADFLAKRPRLRPTAAEAALRLRAIGTGARLPVPRTGAAARGGAHLRHAPDAPLPAGRSGRHRDASTLRRVEFAASATAVALVGGLTFTLGDGHGTLSAPGPAVVAVAAQPAAGATAQSPSSASSGSPSQTTGSAQATSGATGTSPSGPPTAPATGIVAPTGASTPATAPSTTPPVPAPSTTASSASGGLPVGDPIGYLENLRAMIQRMASQGPGVIDANAAGDLENLVLDLENGVYSYQQNGGQGLLQMIKDKIAGFDARLSSLQSRGLISSAAAGRLAAYLQKLSPA